MPTRKFSSARKLNFDELDDSTSSSKSSDDSSDSDYELSFGNHEDSEEETEEIDEQSGNKINMLRDTSIFPGIWDDCRKSSENFENVLIYFSDNAYLNEAINEWRFIGSKESSTDDSFCICSTKIKIERYVINDKNGNILRIGSECIKKFENEMMDQLLKDDDDLIKVLRSRKNRPKMINLIKNVPDSSTPSSSAQTESYLNYPNVSGRECKGCSNPIIRSDAPKFVKYCLPCLRKMKFPNKSVPTLRKRMTPESSIDSRPKSFSQTITIPKTSTLKLTIEDVATGKPNILTFEIDQASILTLNISPSE